MKGKRQIVDEEQGCRKKPQRTCVAEESEERSVGNVDPALIGEIIPEDAMGTVFKNNAHVPEALKVFFRSTHLSSLAIDSPSRFIQDPQANAVECIYGGNISIFDASEITNAEDSFRRGVFLQFKMHVDTFEGEVVDIKISRNDDKEVTGIEILLRTSKGSKAVTLEKYMINGIADVNVGDVVYIEPTAGFIKRLGRSESRANEFDLEGDKYVQLNKMPVHGRKKRAAVVSLQDLDYAVSRYSSDISPFARQRADEIMDEYVGLGLASLLDSCLIIKAFDVLSISQLRILSRCLARMPWVKLLLLGDLSKAAVSRFSKFPCVRTVLSEDPLDILRSRHENFADFSESAEKYLGKVSLEVLSDVISISKDAEEFRGIIETQIIL